MMLQCTEYPPDVKKVQIVTKYWHVAFTLDLDFRPFNTQR